MLIVSACGSVRPYVAPKYEDWQTKVPGDTAQLKYTVYLIGDAGAPEADRQEPTFKLLESMLYKTDTVIGPNGDTTINRTSDPNGSVLFLGDNIYYKGLPPEDHRDRKEMERKLTEQLDVVKNYKGNKFIIPGNHDWDEQGPEGLKAVNRQEKFVEQYLGTGNTFLPSNGCPGPVEVQISSDMVIIIMDSQWWLHKHEKPVGPENGCHIDDKFDLIVKLEDILDRNKGKHIVIAQHHPLFTNGNHGGFYTLKDYIFPITIVRPKMYIPLPVIGAIYPLGRKYGVTPQDLPHPEYQQLKKGILSALEKQKSTVFAAGHEHSLQLFKEDEVHHVVSGSGCKNSYVAKGNDAIFSHEHNGFAKLNYYTNGEAWIEFWEPEGDGSKGKLAFRSPLYALTKQQDQLPADFDCKDSTIVIAASDKYKRSSALGKTFFGEHYREEWQTPVRVHLLDMKCFANGLTPLKKGGGRQTTSIRLIGGDSIQYTLRTISKDPSSLLPEGLRETFANDFLDDQMSSAHPYGPLVIPGMAKALGLYHLKPQLVYVPLAPQLGPYLDDIGGKLAYLEIRPDEDLKYFSDFGYSRSIISTKNMFANLRESSANKVDQQMFLKARLFDILIGDWDRHEDQWRWAEFKTANGLLYKPIPRDRDQVFAKYDGVIPYLVSRYGVKNFSSFTKDFDDLISLGVSSQNLDRTLLTTLSLQDWMMMADSIKTMLSDEVIEKAVRDLPPEIFAISGQDLIMKLKSRRDQLQDAALRYYRHLSGVIDVVGSDQPEFFHVERLNNTDTRVTMYRMNAQRKPAQKLYQRVFKRGETKEVRVYAMNGRDSVLVTGKVARGMKLRIVGGMGYDVIADSSEVKAFGKHTIVYDTRHENNIIIKGEDTKSKVASTYWVNNYNPQDFRYTKFGPKLSAEFNVDDGLFLGGGVQLKRQGFRKDPYYSTSKLVGNYAFRTGSFNVRYAGVYYSLFGRNWDLAVRSNYWGPKYVLNYFGQGNETEGVKEDIDFYRVRLKKFEFAPFVHRRLSNYFTMGIAPFFEYNEVQNGINKFVSTRDFTERADLHRSYFGGGKFFAEVDVADSDRNPTRGSRWTNEINYYNELKGGPGEFTNLNSALTFYYSPKAQGNFTIATRIGGSKNIGAYKFYQANFLGGSTNLRGYRKTRFAGRSAAFGNLEARLRFYRFRTSAFTGTWNVMGFVDTGRVWVDGETSKMWHIGYGPGVGVNVYDLFLLSLYYGVGDEESRFTLKTGWFF